MLTFSPWFSQLISFSIPQFCFLYYSFNKLRQCFKLVSTMQLVIGISAIIAAAEFLIILVINIIPYRIKALSEAALNVIKLALLSTPLTYLLIIKPFVDSRDGALAQVSHLAFTDPLTKLPNRRQLLNHLHRIIADCNRHKTYGALLLIDLDGFKLVNEMHGHDAGDVSSQKIRERTSLFFRLTT